MDTVVNAVVKAHMRNVRRTYNTEAFASFVEAATAAEEKGEELPRWNPPSIPLWKGVYHLHRFVNERMAEREFADGIDMISCFRECPGMEQMELDVNRELAPAGSSETRRGRSATLPDPI